DFHVTGVQTCALPIWLALGDHVPRAAIELDRAELLARDLVAEVAEGAFGELHDVALVHQRHRLAAVGDGVLDRGLDQALGALPRSAERRVGKEPATRG